MIRTSSLGLTVIALVVSFASAGLAQSKREREAQVSAYREFLKNSVTKVSLIGSEAEEKDAERLLKEKFGWEYSTKGDWQLVIIFANSAEQIGIKISTIATGPHSANVTIRPLVRGGRVMDVLAWIVDEDPSTFRLPSEKKYQLYSVFLAGCHSVDECISELDKFMNPKTKKIKK